MANHPGVAAGFFKALNQAGADTHLITTSEIKISAIINKKDLTKTAQAVHTEFKLQKQSPKKKE